MNVHCTVYNSRNSRWTVFNGHGYTFTPFFSAQSCPGMVMFVIVCSVLSREGHACHSLPILEKLWLTNVFSMWLSIPAHACLKTKSDHVFSFLSSFHVCPCLSIPIASFHVCLIFFSAQYPLLKLLQACRLMSVPVMRWLVLWPKALPETAMVWLWPIRMLQQLDEHQS